MKRLLDRVRNVPSIVVWLAFWGLIALLLLWYTQTILSLSPYEEPPRPQGDLKEQAEALSRVWLDADITEIFMLTPHLGWASGSIVSEPKTGKRYAVLLRYTDGKWENVTGPELIDYAFIGDVHMFSSISGYALAVGHKYKEDYDGNEWVGNDHSLLRYNKDKWEEARRFAGEGNRWRKSGQPVPGYRMYLDDLDVISPNEAWITAHQVYETALVQSDIYKVSLPSDEWVRQEITGTLLGPMELAMVSSKEGWAAGLSSGSFYGLYHFEGNHWQSKPFIEAPSEGRFPALITVFGIRDIQMLSVNEGWGIGWISEKDRTGAEEYVPVHYIDGLWRTEGAVPGWNLRDLYMISSNEGWAITSSSLKAADGYEQAILHYVRGQWKEEKRDSMTNKLSGLFMVSADEGWAVGSHGLILHYQHEKWNVYRP
jgi:hypothetical protein